MRIATNRKDKMRKSWLKSCKRLRQREFQPTMILPAKLRH